MIKTDLMLFYGEMCADNITGSNHGHWSADGMDPAATLLTILNKFIQAFDAYAWMENLIKFLFLAWWIC